MFDALKNLLKNLIRDAFIDGIREGVQIVTAPGPPQLAEQPAIAVEDEAATNGRRRAKAT